MKKNVQSSIKPLNAAAQALADPRFRKRVVRDKKTYTRKGRTPRGDRSYCTVEV